MAYGKISAKQQEILDYIKAEIVNKGYPPSVREICEAVNLKSTSTVFSHLEKLEKNGYILRNSSKTRAIEILDENFNMMRNELVNVPIVGNVAAGQPILAVQNIENYFPIPSEFMPNTQTFMLRVKGDSMVPKIENGDLVIVDKSVSWEDNDIVIVRVNGHEGTCKRVKRYAEGISLISINPAYEPMYYSREQVEQLPVEVVGRVMEVRSKV